MCQQRAAHRVSLIKPGRRQLTASEGKCSGRWRVDECGQQKEWLISSRSIWREGLQKCIDVWAGVDSLKCKQREGRKDVEITWRLFVVALRACYLVIVVCDLGVLLFWLYVESLVELDQHCSLWVSLLSENFIHQECFADGNVLLISEYLSKIYEMYNNDSQLQVCFCWCISFYGIKERCEV